MGRLSLKERLAQKRAAEAGDVLATPEGQWYVLHTYSGYENKVKKSIEHRVDALDLNERVFEVVVPTQEEIEIKNGQQRLLGRMEVSAIAILGQRCWLPPRDSNPDMLIQSQLSCR